VNVLFIISDEHKRDVTGCYGHPIVKTPALDRLAAGGVLFENAYCQEPICGPSRASLLTGTYPHTCNAFSHRPKHVLRDLPTLGSVFRDAGYATAAIGKLHVRGEDKTSRDLGFDDRPLRFYTYGGQDYIDAVGVENADRYASHRRGSTIVNAGKYNPTNEPVSMAEELMYDNLVTDLAIEYLERRKDEPFFAWVGLEKPHPQWYAPARFHEMYDPNDVQLPESRNEVRRNLPKHYMERVTGEQTRSMTDEESRACHAAYFANVSYMDMNAGRILDAVERLGLAENTLVVYTSDHGELLLEHNLYQKHCLYEPAAAVPLIVSCPAKLPRGERRPAIVGLIDLFPTFCELTGVRPPEGLEGESLVPILDGLDDGAQRVAFSEMYMKTGAPERMIRSGPWKYIYTHGDLAQLYHRERDPSETENLAVLPEHAELCEQFKARVLDGWEVDTFDIDPE